jgi:lipooligosaccharide transport system ATP-binding protein
VLKENIEQYVLESQKKAEFDFLDSRFDLSMVRMDDSREPPLFYSNDPNNLKRLAEALKHGEYHLRQANLEDLFLKATGMTLNDGQ